MPLSDFPLAWRWCGEGRPLLPGDALASLRPLPAAHARCCFEASLRLSRGGGLDACQFAITGRPAARLDPAEVTAWLLARQGAVQAPVILSWEPELALRTTWGVFARHWNAFCYPASDDLLVFPASGRWAVFYHHAEQLQYGERRLAVAAVEESLRECSARLEDDGAGSAHDSVRPCHPTKGPR